MNIQDTLLFRTASPKQCPPSGTRGIRYSKTKGEFVMVNPDGTEHSLTRTHGELAVDESPEQFATLTTSLAGANNDLVFTAKEAGAVGEEISIEYAAAAARATITVDVSGRAITVTPGTDGMVEVDGAGSTEVNGLYLYAGHVNGKPSWNLASDLIDARIQWSSTNGGTWWIYLDTDTLYYSESTADSLDSLIWSEDVGEVPIPDAVPWTSAASQVAAAIRTNGLSSALVTVADAPGNDGTGSVTAMAATNLALP